MFIFILIVQFAYPQAPVKKLAAVRTSIAPKIDGVLDDEVWKNVPVAADFVENQPVAGRHESTENRTEIKIIYDDKINCLHMNPGAAGVHGWHKVRTLLRFAIDGQDIKNCEVIELGRKGIKELQDKQ